MLSARPLTPTEWSLQRFLNALIAHAPLILGASLLLALLSYVVVARQAPRYQAFSSLMAAPSDSAAALITTAPALPGGAVEQALHSQALVQDMVSRLRGSGLDAAGVARVTADLRRELTEQDFVRLTVQAQLNDQQGGTYIIRAQGQSAQEAKVLADIAADSLLAWDQARAAQTVSRIERSLRSYLATLDRRLAATPAPGPRQVLLQARQSATDRLAQLEQMQQAASGTLSPLASAVAPARPVSTSPLSRAIPVFVLATVLGTALAAWRPRAVRPGQPRARPAELGWLPPIPEADTNWALAAPVPAALRRALTLLRSNILERLPPGDGRVGAARIVVTAARPTPGLSSVTALLARSFAEAGQRVLLIDALGTGTQHTRWNAGAQHWQLLPGASDKAPPAQTLEAALSFPEGAQALNVAPGVELLGSPMRSAAESPPSASAGDPFTLADAAQFDVLLARWGEAYDIVLIDAPPLSVSGDARRLAGAQGHLLVVADGAQNRPPTLAEVLAELPTLEPATPGAGAGPRSAGVLGVVWNDVPPARLGTPLPPSRTHAPELRRPAAESEGL